MNEFLSQVSALWKKFNPLQQFSIFLVSALIVLGLVLIYSRNPQKEFVPLFSSEKLDGIDNESIKNYLDSTNTPYHVSKDSQLLVPGENVYRIRNELTESGFLKNQATKGFDLFDSTTWIKGDKELQMLEIRALKGQLEKDIGEFQNIHHANLILDIPNPRAIGLAGNYNPKASVILILKPQAQLSNEEIQAIANHISGAIRGLNPEMIAISDTTGKLYQAIHSEQTPQQRLESKLKEQMTGMLNLLIGSKNYYLTLHLDMPSNSTEKNLSAYILIDKQKILNAENFNLISSIAKEAYLAQLEKNIEKEVFNITKGYSLKVMPTISFVSFSSELTQPTRVITPSIVRTDNSSWNRNVLLFVVLTLSLLFLGLLYFLRQESLKKNKPLKTEEDKEKKIPEDSFSTNNSLDKENFFKSFSNPSSGKPEKLMDIEPLLAKSDPSMLAHYLNDEPIRSTALMLYHMPESQAAAILSTWPLEKQLAIMNVFEKRQSEDLLELIKESYPILNKTPEENLQNINLTKKAALIMDNLNESDAKILLEAIQETNAHLAEEIEFYLK
jgi:flagellar biosynthesis/type III secretory pathway M-ring protein FliF/YscJ